MGNRHIQNKLISADRFIDVRPGYLCIFLNGLTIEDSQIPNLLNELLDYKFQSISLTETLISENGLEKLLEFLIPLQLDNIYLSNNNLGIQSVRAISNFLSKSDSLTIINLSGNNFGSEGIQMITNALKNNKSLIGLYLADSNLYDEEIEMICKVLDVHPSLEFLDLHLNQITSKGLEHLSNRLYKLNTLDIDRNQIKSVEYLSNVLKTNTSLLALNLSNNQLGNIGASQLGSSLYFNTTLERLLLINTQIDSIGAYSLINGIENNFHLKDLNLGLNAIEEEVYSLFDDLVKTHPFLKVEMRKIHNNGRKLAETTIISSNLQFTDLTFVD